MATDLTVVMRDEPGQLARLGEVTAAAGVHVHGLAAFTGDAHGLAHVLVDDDEAAAAKQALEAAKMHVADTREVLVVDAHQHGLVDALLALAEANVNVDLAYTALGGEKLVIATDDVYNAREALA